MKLWLVIIAYIKNPGVGLIAECEFEFEDTEGNAVKPDEYAIKIQIIKLLMMKL